MFSGEDSSGEGFNALNPYGQFQLASQSAAACGLKTTTTSSGSIDWASLAQQWIQMRDFSGADISTTMPDAPPPPNISGNYRNAINSNRSETQSMKVASIPKRRSFDEQGEADMEMDDDDDSARSEYKNVQPQPNISATPILQPNWFISQEAPASTGNDIDANPQQQVSAQWNPWPPRVLLAPVPILRESTNRTAHIPSLMKINIPDPNMSHNKTVTENHNEVNSIVTMDAAKRKILPAWIREGLEKMEREKQKQLEKQQQNPNDSTDHASFDKLTTFSNQHMVNNKVLRHLDSDNSSCYEEEDDNDRVATEAHTTKKVDSPLSCNIVENLSIQKELLKTGKSYEQKLSDLMIVVRRTLTELLLEVTNQEISNVAHETIKSHKTKATTAHVIPKSAISTITGKLGLAAYDDSSSDTSESEAAESINNENSIDSEEEIRASIRTKRKAFSKTSEEIEERITESALQEEQKLKFYLQKDEEQQKLKKQLEQESQLEQERSKSSNSSKGPTTYTSGKGYEKEFGETSQSKLQLSNGKRQKDRTTRFSDNKDTRGATIVTAADYISHYKCSQIETAAQKINSAVLHMPADGSGRTLTEITSKSMDVAHSSATQTVQESLGKTSRGKSYKKKHQKSSNHSSDNNDSSSDNFDSSETSNSSHSSSKHSRSSSLKHKSNRDQISSSFSTRKSNRDRSHDRYNDGPKRSRRRYRSSDSDDYGEDKHYSSKKYRRHRSSHHSDYHHERKSGRSRSRSRSRSSYTSSRRRH